VAWIDSSYPLGTPRLVVQRLSRDGEMLDPFGVTIAEVAPAADVEVSWNGSKYVVISGTQMWRVGVDGSVEGPLSPVHETFARSDSGETVVVVSNGNTTLWFVASNGARTNPVVLSNSELSVKVLMPVATDWVVLGTDPADHVRWIRVNRQGVVLSNVIATGGLQRSFAASRSHIVISWLNIGPLNANEDTIVFGYTIIEPPSGISRDEFLDNTTVLHGTTPYTSVPVVVFDGVKFSFISSHFEDGEHSIRVRTNSTDVRTITGSDSLHPISAMTLATGYGNLLVWRMAQPRSRRSGSTLFAIPFENADEIEFGPMLQLTTAPATQVQPLAATGASGILVAWRDVSDTSQISARFFPSSGDAPPDFAVSPGTAETDGHAVAATADTFVVAWRELDFVPLSSGGVLASKMRVVVSRYDADGNVLDEEPVVIADMAAPGSELGRRAISVIGDGSSFVVAWVGAFGKMFATRIAARGPIFASVRPTLEAPLAGPVLARAGGRVLALWSTNSLFGAGFNENLVLETPVDLLDGGEILFDAAGNDHELLIAWSDSSCIWTRRFTPGLVPLEPERTLLCDDQSYTPAVTWDGERWWVAAASTNATQALRAWRLGADGSAGEPIFLATSEQRPIDPELVPTASGLSALYSRIDESAAFTWRAFLRPIFQKIRSRAVRH